MSMSMVNFGRTDLMISRIGLGTMPLSIYGRPNRDQAIQVIHRALDLGINLIDAADAYCLDETEKHYSEELIHQALIEYDSSKDILVATKGGLIRPGGAWQTDLNPTRLRQTIRESFQALGGEKPIPLWQIHNSPQDDQYTLKEIFQPIAEAVRLNLIRYVGVSNFDLEQIREVQNYVEIQSVQNAYSFFKRQAETNGVLEYCEQNRITFLAYSPYGGRRKHKQIKKQKILIDLAEKYRCSTYCIALAWLLSKSKAIVPIPGATQMSSIEDSVQALEIQLHPDDIERINQHKFS